MLTTSRYSFETITKNGKEAYRYIYIYGDNHPKAAAYYFWRMHKYPDPDGLLVQKFVKANADVITSVYPEEPEDGNSYGYHIDIDGVLKADKYPLEPPTYSPFITFFKGAYGKFINKHPERIKKEDNFEKLYPLSSGIDAYYPNRCYGYLTLSEVEAIVIEQSTMIKAQSDDEEDHVFKAWVNEYLRFLQLKHGKTGKIRRL